MLNSFSTQKASCKYIGGKKGEFTAIRKDVQKKSAQKRNNPKSSGRDGAGGGFGSSWEGVSNQKVVKNYLANAGDTRDADQEDPLEKELATYFSILAWKIPWTEEPGALQSTKSQRVRHDGAHIHNEQ